MPKYRHKATGRIVERSESYARAVSALEPVEEDTPLSDPSCGPCGLPEPTGVGEVADTYEEPVYQYDERE